MTGVNMDYLKENSTHEPQGPDAYPALADSNPWGAGGVPDRPVTPFGADYINGFYDVRDDLNGSSDTQWNRQPAKVAQDEAQAASLELLLQKAEAGTATKEELDLLALDGNVDVEAVQYQAERKRLGLPVEPVTLVSL